MGTALFWLMLVGFGLKAGFFPLHIWLPSAHANAPSHVSALMSGVAIKMGVYGIVRFSGWLPVSPSAGWILITFGAVSALIGIVFAFAQTDVKRLLAYCSVENIGIIMVGLGGSLLAVTVFGVPVKGSFATLTLAALLYALCATGIGMLASTFTRSQIAAMFFAMIGTLIPAVQFSGLLVPVSSLEGTARLAGEIYPATHMLAISRGVFNKALGLHDLAGAFWALLAAVPVIFGATAALLKKQET